MNYPLLFRVLGIVCLLIGGSMSFSLPFAFPLLARRTHLPAATSIEWRGIFSLLASMAVCGVVGSVMVWIGRGHRGSQLYRKEAMAIVGLSWLLATILGALPYCLGGVQTAPDHPITFIEAMFESQSGFSTTGATILTDLDSPELVPYCILFWRSWTHFLGGLGIVVLFVAILGQGSAGKAMMRAEMPGPSKEGSMPRMQQTALVFATMYVGFNLLLTAIYEFEGMTLFDALCHAFGTMATGGFSTYNRSLGGFDSVPIEYTTILFMIIAGTSFTLLYLAFFETPTRLLREGVDKSLLGMRRLFSSSLTEGVHRFYQDVEFRTYIGIIAIVSVGVIVFGMNAGDDGFHSLASSARAGLFQVVSILTTTGYGTADFNGWNNFGRGILLLLMFVGGCAGSTGGGMKVIRHVLFYKVLRQELEKSHRPRVIRPLRIGGTTVDDPHLGHGIVVYFSIILAIFVFSWLALVTFEPDRTWGVFGRSPSTGMRASVATISDAKKTADELPLRTGTLDEKLLDSASAVAATLNNIGPGLGVVGATQNYAGFSQGAKLLFVWLMMLGRVEVFSVLVLMFPSFWRRV